MDLLWGFSTSVSPSGTLTSVNGGSTCGSEVTSRYLVAEVDAGTLAPTK